MYAILDNDKDANGDKIKIISVSSPRKGGIATINENTTITFMPAKDFVGIDTFSYVISDSDGKTDEGKVSVNIKGVTDNMQHQDQLRQASSWKAQITTPSKEVHTQTAEVTAQKIKNKMQNGPLHDAKITSLHSRQGPDMANNSSAIDDQ